MLVTVNRGHDKNNNIANYNNALLEAGWLCQGSLPTGCPTSVSSMDFLFHTFNIWNISVVPYIQVLARNN